jgi:hypothetical protein
MPYDFGPRLLIEVGSDAATCPVAPCGPRASSIKKSLVVLLVQLGTHVPNARAHVSKSPNIRAIMGLQDVRAGSAANACKACRHVATMRLQYSASTMDHSLDTITVTSDLTTRRHTTDRV